MGMSVSDRVRCRARRLEMIGKTYGSWLVLGEGQPHVTRSTQKEVATCVVRCKCGTERTVLCSSLRCGESKSCGCEAYVRAVAARAPITTHGHCRRREGSQETREYSVWSSMFERCYNSNVKSYHRYGGRGIVVCERWHSFENFLADMGPRPSSKHQLDRYPNNDGNYEKTNCRWATRKQNSRNRSNTRRVTIEGVSVCVAERAEMLQIKPGTIESRLRRGWPLERVLDPLLKNGAPRSSRKLGAPLELPTVKESSGE